MEPTVGFTLDDIFHFFAIKGGKVVYTDIVTHFRYALTDPQTQVEARVCFKDYVNNLANVTIENGKKHLVLKPKFMKKLSELKEEEECASKPNGPIDVVDSPSGMNGVVYHSTEQMTPIKSVASSPAEPVLAVNTDANNASQQRNTTATVVFEDTGNDVPPRPPPRKKNSFSKAKSTATSTVTPVTPPAASNQPTLSSINGKMESNCVKKEIQELARTPGRVKEHAQIWNKFSLDNDHKLPMPVSSNSVHSQVVNKIRSNNHSSDTDSGSLHILEAHQKRWIVACSDCDYSQIRTLLKEDPDLSVYCDYIMGYNALHWAAKFNKPEIIKLLVETYSVDPNIKSFSGCTPLHIAAQFKHQSIMKLLTDTYGADTEIRDNYGRKACHYFESKEKKPNEKLDTNSVGNNLPSENGATGNPHSATNSSSTTTTSATENLKNNLRNKLSHQSMLVRNTLRKSKAFKRRKSMNEKNKKKDRPTT